MRVTPLFYKLAASIAVVTVGSVLVYRALPPRLQGAVPTVTADRQATSEAQALPGGKQFPRDNKLIQDRLGGANIAGDDTPEAAAVADASGAVTPAPPLEERIKDALAKKKLQASGEAEARGGAPRPAAGVPLAGEGSAKKGRLKLASPAEDRAGVGGEVEYTLTQKEHRGQPITQPGPAINKVESDSQQFLIERIDVVGNGRTRDYVIRREIRLAEGGAYNKLLGDQARQRLQNLGFFKSVKLNRRTGSAPDRVILTFVVEEQPTGELSLAGGYFSAEEPMDGPKMALSAETIQENRDQFEAAADNAVKQVAAEPVSTFSIDVDTASYAFTRRALNSGHLPPKDAVRIEEMINYFPYDYPRPESAEVPFRSTVTVVPAPWNPANKLLHIGIKGYELKTADRPRANLVFLIDVSGSMRPTDRLPLVKNAFRMLLDELKPDDTIGIVTCASGSGVALEPTRVAEKGKILAAIDRLGAGGSTAGAQGLQDAHRLAESNFDKAAVNRVILATDGDFNVGITDRNKLTRYIEEKRQTGIFLSILGVGQNNYNDALMQKLAQNGNGTAAYVDTLSEARKVLVDEASSTLFTIAKDVKIQIEFNPAQVSEYRLIGYETRALKREDFNNDKVDAGDIGSGHTVTAIYEVTPVGAPKFVDNLRYGKAAEEPTAPADNKRGELAFLKLRYKLPKEDVSKLITMPVTKAQKLPGIEAAPEDVRFSAAVAAFGQLLRGLPYLKGYSYDDVLALAKTARGDDEFG